MRCVRRFISLVTSAVRGRALPVWFSLVSMLVAPAALAAGTRESFDLQVLQPPAVVSMEGRSQLTGELHLTNFSKRSLEVVSARVVDAKSGTPLVLLDGRELTSGLCRFDPRSDCVPGTTVAPGERAFLFVDAALSTQLLARSIRYEIEYRAGAGEPMASGPVDAPTSVSSHAVSVDSRPSVLGAPLRGGPWVAVHHPEWPRGHRRVFYTVDGRARLPGRFAIDWVKADEQGRIARGDGDRVDAALGYSADVLAVADAVVVAVRADMEESPSLSANPDHTLDEAAGNYVVLKLSADRFAIYEHLRPRSVRVHVGKHVRRGDVIASLGFTGDSTGPHLHLHIADAPSPLGAEGVAYVFDEFTLLGQYDDLGLLGKAPWVAQNARLSARREREWPGFNRVVRFAP